MYIFCYSRCWIIDCVHSTGTRTSHATPRCRLEKGRSVTRLHLLLNYYCIIVIIIITSTVRGGYEKVDIVINYQMKVPKLI